MNSTADEIGSIDCYDYERKGPSNSGQNTFRQMDTDTANGGGGGGPLANGLLLGIAITYLGAPDHHFTRNPGLVLLYLSAAASLAGSGPRR